MGLFSALVNKDIAKAIERIEAENKRKNFSPVNTNSKIKDFVIKTVGFINSYNIGRDMLAPPEYDFEEIKRAAETDSYIKTSLDKYQRMIYKAGYYLKSENEKSVEYIKKRFRVMSYATGKPMDILFQEIADDLITYSNCILIKTRVKQIMPGIKAVGLFGSDPVGGYSRIDPSTISIQRDEHGNVLGYTQRTINGKEKKYKTQDVIHIYMNKESSNAFGTPKVIAALEDVKLLRKLEGNVLAIVHRFAIPIFHWKIGKPQQGFQATDKEIEDARYEIENMSLDGVVITNEKTEINVLGAEGSAINASEYLKYFEQRVFTALDSSASQMGRGGAKQDADSMEAQSHDYIKSVQRTISIFLENFIISELLLEGGFNPIINEKDIVEYVFNEISLDTKIKVENHEMLKYQSNMQTLEEARRNIGYKDSTDEKRLYKNLIEVPAQIKVVQATAKAQTASQVEVAEVNGRIAEDAAKAQAKRDEKLAAKSNQDSNTNTNNNTNSKTNSNSNTKTNSKSNSKSNSSSKTGTLSNGKKASQTPNKDVTNRNRPTNQHGTTSVKVKESLEITEKVIRNKKTHKKKYKDFYSKLERLRNNLIETDNDLDYLFSISIDSLVQEMKLAIGQASQEGIDKAKNDLSSMKIDTTNIASLNIYLDSMYEKAHADIKDVFKDIKTRLDNNRELENVDAVINALEYRFRFMIEYILPKTVWYSYLKAGEAAGIKKAKVDFGDSSDSEKYDDVVNINAFSLDQIPAFHPFCDCKLKFIKNEAGEK